MSGIVTDPTACPRVFETALHEGNVERTVTLHDEEAVLRVQSDEIQPSSVAVHAEMQQLIASKANFANTLRRILQHGDVALIIVEDVLRLTAPDGSPVLVKGTATNVIQNHREKGSRMIIANPQGAA